MRLFRIAYKDLKASKHFLLFFLLNLSLGLFGLVLVQSFKSSFSQALTSKSRELLGADLSIEGRNKLSPTQRTLIENKLKPIQTIDSISLFAMLSAKNKSHLVYLTQHEKGFPFYGEILLKKTGSIKEKNLSDGEIWVYPELLLQFGVEIGDVVKIGEGNFRIAGVVEEDTTQGFQMGSAASRVIISNTGIKKASLLKKGSTAFYKTFFKTILPIEQKLEEDLISAIDDSSLKLVTPAKSSAQVGRVTNYLSDFLGLVSLVALMLSLIGIFYLFRSYLDAKKYTFAILRSLGLTIKEVFIMQIISLLILSSLSILMSFLLTSITLPILNGYISNIFEMDIHLSLTIATISFTLLVGYLSPLLVGIPLLISYLKQKTLNLFQEGRDIFSGFSFKHIFKFAPLIFFFTLLSSWLSQSIKTSLIFIGILIFIFSILFPLFYWILGLLERHLKLNKLELNLSLRYMARYRIASISIFLALLFSCLLITLIPALENNLNTELNMASKDKTPSLFLFDIQEEQVNGLKKFSKEKNVELLGLSPMVRGRLVKINGEDFKVDTSEALTREEESSQRLRNRGINITYKEILGDNEKIIEGDELGAVREGELPDISLEYRYAQRMGISLGDKMTFEISGIEQEGIVRNFRKVRWTSFMPSFFINFPPGVFEDAPKTFLAAVPNLEVREKSEYQFKLTELFPNISSLELDALISKIKSVIEQISLTITVMSLLVVLVGMIVVFSLINHQLNERRKDIFLLKILGLKYPQLRLILLNEFFILAVSASILGLFLGIFISYGFSYFLFEGIWFFDITYLILILSSFVILVMLITWLTSFKILKEKPILFL